MLNNCPRCKNSLYEFEKGKWMCVNYKDPYARKDRNGEPSDGECDFFFDKDGYDYMLEELINRTPKGFYSMSNEPLADAYYEILSKDYPGGLYIKMGISQYFAISKNGKKYMMQLFDNDKRSKEASLLNINAVLDKIKSSDL